MFWDNKTLFDDVFFEGVLAMGASHPFTVRYIVSDTRDVKEPKLSCFAGIKGEHFDGSDYALQAYRKGVRVFIVGKGLSLPEDAAVFTVPNVVEALGKLASAHRDRLMIPHVLITGSVGKTTTRLLCAAVLGQKYPVHTAKKNFNNEIGLPLSILETPAEAKASILEAGMSGSGEIGRLSKIVRPEIAVITNVHLIHAGPLGGLEGVAAAKAEIVEGMDEHSLLLLNEEDPFKSFFAAKARGRVVEFRPSAIAITRNLGARGFFFRHSSHGDEEFLCPLAGQHLKLNLAAAFALAEIFNVPAQLIKEGLAGMPPLAERMNFLAVGKATLIADCYNASLPSFKAALEVLGQSPPPRTAVIGDILELGPFAAEVHRELRDFILGQNCADEVWVQGEETLAAWRGLGCQRFASLGALAEALPSLYKKGGTVLLKASHGMGFGSLVPGSPKSPEKR